ncbi:hypothetical protein [Aquisphaera giovannonii]|nr:hypothetical protein [Aquisphaera giovannonii]
MRRTLRCGIIPAILMIGSALGRAAEPARELPPALAPLEFLVGTWKGQGVPKDDPSQRFRGWTETHTWAWAFEKGKPVALTVSIRAGKVLSEGRLTPGGEAGRYRLEGKEPGERGKPVAFAGTLDASGKLLKLERPAPGGGIQRLSIRANGNYIRYVMTVDQKPAGSQVFAPKLEVGLTREGESFAAGSSSADRPRCVVTGGAATMSVSYNGQSYPVCCTGCVDEFKENPAKYLKKLAASGDGASKGTPSKPSAVSRFEDAFAGDGEDTVAPDAKAKMPAARPSGEPATTKAAAPAAGVGKDAEKASARRAASALQVARNLEKAGKREAALKAYRQFVKDFAGTPQARSAASRISALEAE